VLIKLGDDISTDHISPAGSEYLAYRSNIPKLSEFVFARVDPEFARRAREWGGGAIVGGENYGQGSSREHAAIAPMYLGVRGVLSKAFARIHHANLINWGLVPMVFENPADWANLEQGDEIEIPGIRAAIERGDDRFIVHNRTKGTQIPVRVSLNQRERAYILAGGKLAYTKLHPVA
jgi:aconitate hydratase